MIEIKIEGYSDLSEKEKQQFLRHNAEWDDYLRVTFNGKTIILESSGIEPEDVRFCRDLSWIKDALQKCYELGRTDLK